MAELKANIRAHTTSNSLTVYAKDYGHLPSRGEARILHKDVEKKDIKMVEVANITEETTNHRDGFSKVANLVHTGLVGKPGTWREGAYNKTTNWDTTHHHFQGTNLSYRHTLSRDL